jgi:hypothetical protein
MVLVDTNVILDVATADPCWSAWSGRQLVHWLDAGPVVINAIIYGEIALPVSALNRWIRSCQPMPC